MTVLRQASLIDALAVVNILNMALQKKHDHGDDAWGNGLFNIDEIIPNIQTGELYIAEDNGNGVAVVILQDSDENMWYSLGEDNAALYIHRLASSKKGCGSSVITLAEEVARQKGKRCLRLDSSPENKYLYGYYLDHGFKEVMRTKTGTGTEMHVSALMQKDLEAH